MKHSPSYAARHRCRRHIARRTLRHGRLVSTAAHIMATAGHTQADLTDARRTDA